uniref:hypothetical protein n=1 Tax=Sinorhizobium chiapasense TaxID=501572 RepID=UPI002FDF63A9
MSRKIKVEKAQKMNLMLSQAVTAMRVNERLMCRLLRWAASHSQDPHRFIEKTVEEARNDLRQAVDDGSTTSAIAAGEALEYLDDLAVEIKTKGRRKRQRQINARPTADAS